MSAQSQAQQKKNDLRVEKMGGQIRGVPTDHMLVDSLTKSMNSVLLMKYMNDYVYCFKYDDAIRETKRFAAKQRKEERELTCMVG